MYIVIAYNPHILTHTHTLHHTPTSSLPTQIYFANIIDIKVVMKLCGSLHGGLNKLAETLDVERIGPQHQVGTWKEEKGSRRTLLCTGCACVYTFWVCVCVHFLGVRVCTLFGCACVYTFWVCACVHFLGVRVCTLFGCECVYPFWV